MSTLVDNGDQFECVGVLVGGGDVHDAVGIDPKHDREFGTLRV